MDSSLQSLNLSFIDKIVDWMSPPLAPITNIYGIFVKLSGHLQEQFLYEHDK